MSKKIIIIGGGIIGCSCAFYLRREGFEVTIIDRSDMNDGCSYGNAGYICPSHFVPMAAPGIISQGLKWMLNSKSPFYIRPRLNRAFIDWGWKFMKSATREHVAQSAIPLRDIALLSKQLYEEWRQVPGFDFSYEPKGLLEFFQTKANARHAEETVTQARALGLEATVLSKEAVQLMQPGTSLNISGAVYFTGDAQLDPNKLMSELKNWLLQNGVQLVTNSRVNGFAREGRKITKVKTSGGDYDAGQVIIAAGTWSRELAAHIGVKLPMVGGRGYSVTMEPAPYRLPYPVILSEARVALSPMNGNKLRLGGTMEITPPDTLYV